MRIFLFYPSGWQCCPWNVSDGLTATLRRLGHEAEACDFPTMRDQITRAEYQAVLARAPAVSLLNQYDAILISGLEHIVLWFEHAYGDKWKQLKVPVASWYAESLDRDDFNFDFEKFQPWATQHFFPAIQDAERTKSTWLPFGFDAEIFRPSPDCEHLDPPHDHWFAPLPKKYGATFVGTLYEKRARFLEALARHLDPAHSLLVGSVRIEDLGGPRMREMTELYAANIRQSKIMLSLPAMVRCMPTKPYEIGGCGTFLLAPYTVDDLRDQERFGAFVKLNFYDPAQPAKLAEKIRYWLDHEAEREQAAQALCREMHAKHRLEQRLEVILATIGVPSCPSLTLSS